MSLLHSIPFKHVIHFLACITLDIISLSSVPLVSKIIGHYVQSENNALCEDHVCPSVCYLVSAFVPSLHILVL